MKTKNTKYISPIGENWDDYEKRTFTPEEIAEADFKAALLGELIKARQEKGVSQRVLGEMSGVRQPIIARLERDKTDPHLSTLFKILAPLGKTLKIVPIESK